MPTPSRKVKLALTGGIDCSALPLNANRATFNNLSKFRPSSYAVGQIEQTPWFLLGGTNARGTYWDGSSITEPSSSSIRAIFDDSYFNVITITDYCAFWGYGSGATQIQAFHQTAYPAGDTLIKGCALTLNNVAGLGLTLGSTLDVVIDGATTFKWRKNGGAYTTLVPITVSVSIDGGNAVLSFLTTSGFNVGDTWQWQRTDSVQTGLITSKVQYEVYRGLVYFLGPGRRLLVFSRDSLNVPFVKSVGYQPIYGMAFTFYFDHLVVGQYAKSPTFSGPLVEQNILAWSDKTDIENFIATDVNEADQYIVPANVRNGGTKDNPSAIISVFVQQQQLFVLTNFKLSYTNYLGLPIVFAFSDYATIPTFWNVFTNPLVAFGLDACYIIGTCEIYRFAGGAFTPIAAPILPAIGVTANTLYRNLNCAAWGYNKQEQEVIFIFAGAFNSGDATAFVYQERTQRWYSYPVSFTNAVTCISVITTGTGPGYLLFGCANRAIMAPDSFGTGTPVADRTNGTVFGTPKATLQCLGQFVGTVKETSSIYVAAEVTTVGNTANGYSTGANLQIVVAWYNSDTGTISGSPTTDANAVWTSASTDGNISLPRIAYRALAFELQASGLVSNKPPAYVKIQAIEPDVTESVDNVER